MRQHELLYFIDALTCGVRGQPGRQKDAPTREELTINYFKFQSVFGGEGSNMRAVLRQLRAKKAIKEAPCGPHCHGRHVWITALGRALLEDWNQNGCESELRERKRCIRQNGGFDYPKMAS